MRCRGACDNAAVQINLMNAFTQGRTAEFAGHQQLIASCKKHAAGIFKEQKLNSLDYRFAQSLASRLRSAASSSRSRSRSWSAPSVKFEISFAACS
jgi:hypothetical protein